LKILITHELFLPDFHGGGEKIVYKLAKGLQEKGINVKVVTTGNPNIKEYDGIQTVRLPIRLPINKIFKQGVYEMNFSLPWIIKHARDVDLIQTNNYNACLPSFLAGKIMKKPVVCLVHGVYGNKWIKMRGYFFGTLSKYVEKIQVRHNFDKIIFYSDFARKQGLEIGIPKERTCVIRVGVDYKKYRIDKKDDYVLFVGRLAKQKGLDNLMKVAKELPDIRFKLVGSGEEEQRLRKTAPSNVKLMGFKEGEELVDIYAKAPIFCLPSLAETFGIAILEAMASGCAIVSTVPLDYHGVRVDYGDIPQLKNAIRYLVDNPKIAKRMGVKNREVSKKYTWESFVNGFIKVYENLI